MAAWVTATTACEASSVFPAWIMTGVSDVALAVSGFIPVEVVECPFSTIRHRPCVAMARIVTVIDVAIEAMRAMEPRASSKEHPANEPIRPVVAVWCAWVGSVVEVSIRANWRDSNVHGDLRGCGWTAGKEHSSSKDQ